MLKRCVEVFSSIIATIASGLCLLVSLFMTKIFNLNIPIYLDPAWIAVIILGTPLLYSAVKKLVFYRGISKISSALLITVAMISAIIIGDLFAAGEVAFIMAIGEILEDKTTDRAKRGLKKLLDLVPDKARVLLGDKCVEVDAKDLKPEDIIRILPGEKISADSVIINGNTSVNQSVITGESLPIDKGIGKEIYCGTLNCDGSVDAKVISSYGESSLQKLIKMVKDAESKKAPMQRVADKWASWLVPVALTIAIVAGIISQNPEVAVTVLVVFCPCALVLATPTAIMAAIGQATKYGVIIKSGEALEKMSKVNTVAFDKTGTLTVGYLELSEVIAFGETTKKEILRYAASVENRSEHPIAKAITDYANKLSLELYESTEFLVEVGKGVSAKVFDKNIICGNFTYISNCGIEMDNEKIEILQGLGKQGKATVIVVADGKALGIIALSDSIKPGVFDTIKSLKQNKVDAVLLSGDTEYSANYIAEKAQINRVHAQLLPQDKVERIKELKESGNTVCMVGDGINDAPALKVSDVGIAMGAMGTDIAVDAADIALMNDDISKISYLKRLSVATVRTIKFSIFLSLIINFAAIILSFLGLLTPTTGALVHNAGSVFVVLIAALLYDRKFDM